MKFNLVNEFRKFNMFVFINLLGLRKKIISIKFKFRNIYDDYIKKTLVQETLFIMLKNIRTYININNYENAKFRNQIIGVNLYLIY